MVFPSFVLSHFGFQMSVLNLRYNEVRHDLSTSRLHVSPYYPNLVNSTETKSETRFKIPIRIGVYRKLRSFKLRKPICFRQIELKVWWTYTSMVLIIVNFYSLLSIPVLTQ